MLPRLPKRADGASRRSPRGLLLVLFPLLLLLLLGLPRTSAAGCGLLSNMYNRHLVLRDGAFLRFGPGGGLSLAPTSSFSVFLRFRLLDAPAGEASAYVLRQGSGTAPFLSIAMLELRGPALVSGGTAAASVAGVEAARSLQVNATVWQNWIVTYDAATRLLSLYQGQGSTIVESSSTDDGGGGGVGLGAPRVPESAGSDVYIGLPAPFGLALDNLRMWTVALPASDARAFLERRDPIEGSLSVFFWNGEGDASQSCRRELSPLAKFSEEGGGSSSWGKVNEKERPDMIVMYMIIVVFVVGSGILFALGAASRVRQMLAMRRAARDADQVRVMLREVRAALHDIRFEFLNEVGSVAPAGPAVDLSRFPRIGRGAAADKVSAEQVGADPLGPAARAAAQQECTICLDALFPEAGPDPAPGAGAGTGGEDVILLPCSHVFHVSCIARWVEGHSACPLCKRDLRPCAPATAPAPGAGPGPELDAMQLDAAPVHPLPRARTAPDPEAGSAPLPDPPAPAGVAVNVFLPTPLPDPPAPAGVAVNVFLPHVVMVYEPPLPPLALPGPSSSARPRPPSRSGGAA
eukprot:tig00000640_g2768.t1